jgi:hypothetical protein
MTDSRLWIPRRLKPVVKRIRVVFYRHIKMNRIMVGFPEEFPAPKGCEKIICETAKEVELWSGRMREQEKRDEERTDEEREFVEGQMRDYVRKELIAKMMTSKNALNRDFCRQALERLDEQQKKRKIVRESYMHAEAYEDGK